ncbi:MAG: hypothetical protein R3175_12395 [Marinobacter sp.]|nr:hypothetical protein [Marinobacter sp.]MDX1756854.1 hypothetical protein [Marinobacter sp.]
MQGKPDTIRALVVVFVIGLAVTGITSLQASENDASRGEQEAAEVMGYIR